MANKHKQAVIVAMKSKVLNRNDKMQDLRIY